MVTNLSSHFGPGTLFACQKWPKLGSYWGKCSQMCQVMCVMSGEWAALWVVPGTAAGKPVTGALSRKSPLEESTCEGVSSLDNNVTCNASWQYSWQCPTRLSGGRGPTSWSPEMLTLRTLFTSRRREKWEMSGLGDASWFLFSCSLWLAEAWDVLDTFFINTVVRKGC